MIAVQPQLQQDSVERSEAYLRAILLSLNPSISPDEDPAAPPAWSGPPQETITILNLLYASLLMSLLAAFIAMLGKQWLNVYRRHSGGSMVERCGDRQRKFDSLKKWPFHLFVESLPLMLQVALLFLTCGLSRYMWSVNTSVARVVISFTVLGSLFYVGIVIAGALSRECPFQTPASTALRDLRDSAIARKSSAALFSLSPSNVIPLIHAARRDTRELLRNLPLPSVTSLLSATWLDARNGFVSASHRVYEIMRYLLYRVPAQTTPLPTTVDDTTDGPLTPQYGPGLQARVWNLNTIRSQNADDARCVPWALRNITDPEAIDSAICLAGIIRWFDGDPDQDPPFDFVASAFEACFDSTKQVYPGMRNRAYFSARAILQISVRARAHSTEHAHKYRIPGALSFAEHTDPDLCNILSMLKDGFNNDRPSLHFPDAGTCTHTHSLWMSNLFLDIAHMGPNPTLIFYGSPLSAAVADNQAMIANILLMSYMFLGGQVGEEIFWAVDKSYVVILLYLSAYSLL